MDKPDGQERRAEPQGRGPGSQLTRAKLMAAAVEVIAEMGWGRVTTRAVAERAGLPHGAVSYHFRGKQELLIDACMDAFSTAVPFEEFASLSSVSDLIDMIGGELDRGLGTNPVLSRLMFEAMREAERDDTLRERMGVMMDEYRQVVVATVRADQQRGAISAAAPAEGIALLVTALGDGLFMHTLLDPDLEVARGLEALRALLAPN